MKNWFYEQLAMYAAYHRDPRNQLTHHVGVPMIVFSLLLAAATVPLITLTETSITLATILMTVLLLVYIVAIPLVGMLALLFYGVLLMIAHSLVPLLTDLVLPVALGLFIGGWAIQFWGHVYEGRKPALFDNLLQIFMAPAFLIAELLFAADMLTALQAELRPRMGQYLPGDAEDGDEAAGDVAAES